jgi:hypothetical protein
MCLIKARDPREAKEPKHKCHPRGSQVARALSHGAGVRVACLQLSRSTKLLRCSSMYSSPSTKALIDAVMMLLSAEAVVHLTRTKNSVPDHPVLNIFTYETSGSDRRQHLHWQRNREPSSSKKLQAPGACVLQTRIHNHCMPHPFAHRASSVATVQHKRHRRGGRQHLRPVCVLVNSIMTRGTAPVAASLSRIRTCAENAGGGGKAAPG